MRRWAEAPESRNQLCLFRQYLDEVIGPDHIVRFVDEVLGLVDWSSWEASYHLRLGQPPIHPRVLASVLLYGLLNRVRSSRALEESLTVRIDFRWLVSGHSIDHSTLSRFRHQHHDKLRELFVQIGVLAREMQVLKLDRLAFDGTRIRANNRRSGTRSPAQLKEIQAELFAKFDQDEAAAAQKDREDEEIFTRQLGESQTASSPADQQARSARLKAAFAELNRIEQAGETLPKRLPITDPDSRVMPNKEGGFAPNYTPTATVDMSSGLIVHADVLPVHNEDSRLIPSLQQVQQDFKLETLPPEVAADGLMATGANLAACQKNKVTLYSPCQLPDPSQNPALRESLTTPVSDDRIAQLPTTTVTIKKVKATVFEKSAFVYDREHNCYWCPQGQALPYRTTTTEKSGTGQRIRQRFQGPPETCVACGLRPKCVHPSNPHGRQINREQYEEQRESHARHMATPEARVIYSQRRHVGERPFAVIKQQFGLRQFLLRGQQRTHCEWLWAAIAFNVQRLFQLPRIRPGPLRPSQ